LCQAFQWVPLATGSLGILNLINMFNQRRQYLQYLQENLAPFQWVKCL
jgi:hypothetical protein